MNKEDLNYDKSVIVGSAGCGKSFFVKYLMMRSHMKKELLIQDTEELFGLKYPVIDLIDGEDLFTYQSVFNDLEYDKEDF